MVGRRRAVPTPDGGGRRGGPQRGRLGFVGCSYHGGIFAFVCATTASGPPPTVNFRCGEQCYSRLVPHCADSIRLQLSPEPMNSHPPYVNSRDQFGALGAAGCKAGVESDATRSLGQNESTITVGALTATWDPTEHALKFTRGSAKLFQTLPGSIGFQPKSPVPPPPSTRCTTDCGDVSGVRRNQDVASCIEFQRVPNESTAEGCCSICKSTRGCKASVSMLAIALLQVWAAL